MWVGRLVSGCSRTVVVEAGEGGGAGEFYTQQGGRVTMLVYTSASRRPCRLPAGAWRRPWEHLRLNLSWFERLLLCVRTFWFLFSAILDFWSAVHIEERVKAEGKENQGVSEISRVSKKCWWRNRTRLARWRGTTTKLETRHRSHRKRCKSVEKYWCSLQMTGMKSWINLALPKSFKHTSTDCQPGDNHFRYCYEAMTSKESSIL